MFQVICIATGEAVTVYAVSGVRFLIWKDSAKDPHWEWAEMAQFRPVTEEDMAEQEVWE